MEELIADSNNAFEMSDSSKDTLQEVGFIILDDQITCCNLNAYATTCMDGADKYIEIQPKMEAHGILGPEYRSGPKGAPQLCFSAAFTEESLKIAEEVLPRLAAQEPSLAAAADGSFYFPTISAFFIKQPNGPPRHWFHVNAPKEAPFVALVALTSVFVHIVPHSAKYRPTFESLVTDAPLLVPKEVCHKLDTAFPKLSMLLEAGQVMIVHRGTPVCFEGIKVKETPEDVEEEAVFVVKSVVLELLRKTTRRKIFIAQAMEKGGVFPEKLFNEDFPLELLEKCPIEQKLFKVAVPVSVSKVEVLSAAKMSSSSDESLPSSASASDSSSPPPPAPPSVRPALQEQFTRYDGLMKRARALDARVWNERLADTATKKYINLQNASAPSAEIAPFKKVVDTLEKNVVSAEADAPKLPAILEKLAQCEALLEPLKDMPADAKKEIIQYDALKKVYNEHAAPNMCLIPAAKKVDNLLERCIVLQEKVGARIDKLAAKKGKRARQAEPPAAAAAAPVTIEPVDEDELEPDMRIKDGDDGWKKVIDNANSERLKYVNMAQSLANPIVFEYCNKFETAYNELIAAIRQFIITHPGQNPEELDVSTLVAYHRALQDVFVKFSPAATAAAAATAPIGPVSKSSTCKCTACGDRKANFGQSGHCRACYMEVIHTPRATSLENRADAAGRQIKINARDGVPAGELEANFKEYLSFSTAYTKVLDAFEESPNLKLLTKFNELYERADKLLPPATDEEEDVSFGGGSDEEEEEEEDGSELVALPNDYCSEDSSSGPRRKKREREVSPDEEIAVLGMDVLSCFPVQSAHQKAYTLWKEKSKRERLRHYLEELKETTVVWAIVLTDLTDPDAPKVEHDCYIDKHLAELTAAPLREPGVTSADVVKREIVW